MLRALLLILTINLNAFASSQAQSIFNQADSATKKKVKAGAETFTYYRLSSGRFIIVDDAAADSVKKVFKAQSKTNSSEVYPQKIDPCAITDVFVSVFTQNELKKLLPERHIIIMISITAQTGKIASLTYLLTNPTSVSPEKLAKLSSALKNRLAFKIPEYQISERSVICNYVQRVPFEWVLNSKCL